MNKTFFRIGIPTLIICLLFISKVPLAWEKPSITMLFRYPPGIEVSESLKLADIVYRVFADSGEINPIPINMKYIIWPSIDGAIQFSLSQKADYLIFINLFKQERISYEAELINLKEKFKIATFKDSWAYYPSANITAMSNLASKIILASTNKVTVNMIIESTPDYCDVYRESDRLGHTDKDAGFRKTYWWDKGSYRIYVKKPEHEDFKDSLKVEDNPTNYSKKVTLKKK